MTREVPGNLYVCSVLAVVNTNQSLETGGAQERKKENALKSYSSRYEEFFRSSSKGNLRIVKMATLGGIRDSHGSQNSVELEDLARFAVQEHNKKQNAILEFARLVKAQEQVVAGTMHHLTLEVIDAGKKKIYEAKVWVKPWLNFKELQEFKHVGDTSPSLTSSDLGVKKDGHGEGWKSVATHDPQVQDAANHAMNTIKQKSNSLVPYELQEVVHAKAEVIEELAKFEMLLKVKRGSKEEKIKVQVHKNKEGTFHVNQMESDST